MTCLKACLHKTALFGLSQEKKACLSHQAKISLLRLAGLSMPAEISRLLLACWDKQALSSWDKPNKPTAISFDQVDKNISFKKKVNQAITAWSYRQKHPIWKKEICCLIHFRNVIRIFFKAYNILEITWSQEISTTFVIMMTCARRGNPSLRTRRNDWWPAPSHS